MESLLNKGKEHEKKYEWLQAAGIYEEAFRIALKANDVLKAAELQEQMGHSLFRAALQAQTNDEFRSRMLQSVEYNNEATKLFFKCENEEYHAKEISCQAKAIFAKSWIETNPAIKRNLLNEWWNLNHKALEIFDQIGDHLNAARICNDLMEGSIDCKYWIELNWKESEKIRSDLISLGEKAISLLYNTDDDIQLSRAYTWLSVYYMTHNTSVFSIKKEFIEKGLACSQKALEHSEKTQDFWLIGWSKRASWNGGILTNDYSSLKEITSKMIECGKITRDNYLTGLGKLSHLSWGSLFNFRDEDPAKHREYAKHNLKLVPETIRHLEIINMVVWNAYFGSCNAFLDAASIALDIREKKALLKNAVEYGKKSVADLERYHQSNIPMMINACSRALYQLSQTENNQIQKRQVIEELLENTFKGSKILKDYANNKFFEICNQSWMIIAKAELADFLAEKRIDLLTDSVESISTCMYEIRTRLEIEPEFSLSLLGDFVYKFGEIYNQLYSFTKEKVLLYGALEIYDFAITLFRKIGLINRIAESLWQKAKIHDQLGEHIQASKSYTSASESYLEATEKIPQLKNFYEEHSLYMQAWSHIEQARHSHSLEVYDEARQYYQKAAGLHESTGSWSYLAPNYLAWANLEEAESLSRKENILQAKQKFQKALEQFSLAEESMRSKLEELLVEEKEMTQRLLEASDLRQRYCQARMLMEEAKLLDREGKYRQSSRNYEKASQTISTIVERTDVEIERKELEYVAILCQAWEKMAVAEEATSSESYLEAAELFEKAKEYCFTKKASLWALGNSSFCRGLASGIEYQTRADLREHSKAKSLLKNAANSYLQAGFKQASEYARATQRLLDAYAFMNQAENELDQERRAKQYQMAENLLQIAAGSFLKAKQPDKQAQVQEILSNVKEEKALAVSLNQVMQAPTIASSTLSFSAPTPTSEASVGLEKFEHANVQANLVTTLKQVKVAESFCLSVEFVNAGREPALLMRVEDFVPSDFVVVKKPEIYRIEETTLNMKGKQIEPLKLVEVKLTLQASIKGEYSLNPKVHYLDERGQNKTLQLKTLEIKVEEVVLENRVSTGTMELDSLMMGGIPKEYAVVLSGSPCDERELLINNFLKAGVEDGISFYVTTEATNLEDLLNSPNFFLFLCNPKPKVEVPDLPNVFKLQGKTNLTNLGIALIKAQRNINPSVTNKRICVEILSDVLVKHRENTTREWISGLITNYGAKGFTILAIMDPSMHPSNQANAVINLFDGEISITQSDDPLDCKKSIHVKKLRNQDYIKNPICLR